LSASFYCPPLFNERCDPVGGVINDARATTAVTTRTRDVQVLLVMAMSANQVRGANREQPHATAEVRYRVMAGGAKARAV